VGAWRAEVDAEVRESDFQRELSLHRIEETIRWVDAEATYIWERADAAQRGERLGYGTRQPVVLGSLWLAGDAGVLMQWLRARDDLLNRPDPMITIEESELLRDVSISPDFRIPGSTRAVVAPGSPLRDQSLRTRGNCRFPGQHP
jgi:hypothetical protein